MCYVLPSRGASIPIFKSCSARLFLEVIPYFGDHYRPLCTCTNPRPSQDFKEQTKANCASVPPHYLREQLSSHIPTIAFQECPNLHYPGQLTGVWVTMTFAASFHIVDSPLIHTICRSSGLSYTIIVRTQMELSMLCWRSWSGKASVLFATILRFPARETGR